jgi:outer membrane protein assembly factor BamD
MKAVKIFALAIALLITACGGKPKNKVALEEQKPGRDQELFRQGIDAIRKGRYDEGRMLLNTMINTYTESPLIRVAKLSMADSFYLEGGSKNLAQAEVEYRNWLEFFPDDKLADDVMIKIAEIHLRQVMAADRDTTHAKLAERQLKELLRRHPNTDRKEEVEARMREVQEILAMHELKVARFYYDIRESAQAAQMRTQEILDKYPNFSRFDEALWLHAKALADQEDTETASQDLARIITNYPHSEYRKQAEALLRKWNKPVPEPDPTKLAEKPAGDKSVLSRFGELVLGPRISNISSKGVIIDRDLRLDEIVARAQELAGGAKPGGPVAPGSSTTTNVSADRPRRAVQAGQDVEVKPGSTQKEQKPSEKDKAKKKSSGPSKVIPNP